MKTLSEMLNGVGDVSVIGNKDCAIAGIAFDSRKVLQGFLFAAIPGTAVDGHRFIPTAIENGATSVLCEQLPENPDAKITWILAVNSSVVLGQIASNFSGNPSSEMKIVGITGTNGKTTTATLLYRLFKELGHKVGLLSTVCNFIAVSYTHLRAHETRHDLVCRLLLEKKKKK